MKFMNLDEEKTVKRTQTNSKNYKKSIKIIFKLRKTTKFKLFSNFSFGNFLLQQSTKCCGWMRSIKSLCQNRKSFHFSFWEYFAYFAVFFYLKIVASSFSMFFVYFRVSIIFLLHAWLLWQSSVTSKWSNQITFATALHVLLHIFLSFKIFTECR